MRKIYSLVLLAAMLLVGTNIWAQNTISVVYHNGTTPNASFSDLQTAINSVAAGDSATITLSATQVLDAGILIPQLSAADTIGGVRIANRAGQRICINLNGYNIQTASTTDHCCIALIKGVLRITGNGIVKRYDRAKGDSNWKRGAILVSGTDGRRSDYTGTENDVDRSKQVWSTLYIDPAVSVISEHDDTYGIGIQDIGSSYPSWGNFSTKFLGYTCKYGSTGPMWTVKDGAAQWSAFGVKVIVDGTIYGKTRGINVLGSINQTPGKVENHTSRQTSTYPYYEHNFPYIKVGSNANVYCDPNGITDNGNGGIYLGGWAVVDICGTVHGQTGIMVKAGDVKLIDGDVHSDSETAVNEGNYHGTVGGSGIFVVSSDSYAGESTVTVTGDSYVAGAGGSAIIDVLGDGANDSKVTHVSVTGGTIEGGDQGAINLTTTTGNNTSATGGNVQGEVSVDGNTVDVSTLVPNTDDYHTTTVTDAQGKTTVVVSQGAAPTGDANVADGHDANSSVKWTGATETISADLTLKELEINEATAQTLTIAEGKTLTVGRIVLGANAQIIVKPTAKLIVNGTQGIVAPVVTNLILEANNTTQGTMLFNPAVNSNRQPYATVQFTTAARQIDESNYVWQRLTSPLAEVTAVTYTLGTITPTSGSFFTALCNWDYVNNTWASMPSLLQMKAFEGYALTNNANAAGVRYNFKGRIQGTVSDDLVFKANGWNFFGNAYTGSMHVMTMLSNLNNSKVEQTAYVWNVKDGLFETVNKAALDANMTHLDTIPALQTVVFRMVGANPSEMNVKMNYNKSVWEFGTKTGDFAPSSPAPKRIMSNYNSVRISVTAEDGTVDRVTLIEKDSYTDEYESGADAEKLMNENHINFYALTDVAQAIVATDDMKGTLLSLQTLDDVNYTMSFDKVNGDVYALRDNLTNTVVLMNEGATYHFMAQSNATLDGRFQIVSRQEMPTAVETIEETVNAPKAIYTIMGQYVGETTDWNNLPAGVYVVDGVKIVK